jgi:hypothetical protein
MDIPDPAFRVLFSRCEFLVLPFELTNATYTNATYKGL